MREFLIPAITATASVVGILVALDQVTAEARLRCRSTFWRELRLNSALPNDAEVFQSLEREANARIIAFQALPASRLFFPALSFMAGIYFAWSSSYTAGSIPPADLSWATLQSRASNEGLELAFLMLPPFLVFFAVINSVNILVGRDRIANAYLDGKTIERRNVSAQGDHWPAAKILGLKGIFALFAFGVGALCLAVAYGFTAGRTDQSPTSSDLVPPWIFIPLLAGVICLMAGVSVFVRVSVELTRPWVHPKPLKEQMRVANGSDELNLALRSIRKSQGSYGDSRGQRSHFNSNGPKNSEAARLTKSLI